MSIDEVNIETRVLENIQETNTKKCCAGKKHKHVHKKNGLRPVGETGFVWFLPDELKRNYVPAVTTKNKDAQIVKAPIIKKKEYAENAFNV